MKSLLSGKIIATRDMGYSLPLITQNFLFFQRSFHQNCETRSSLAQTVAIFWLYSLGKTTKFCETSQKTTHILEFVSTNCLPDSSDLMLIESH